MLEVLTVREVARADVRQTQIGKTANRELRGVFCALAQRLDVGMLVRGAMPRVRRFHTEPVEHGEHGDCFETLVSLTTKGMTTAGMTITPATRCTKPSPAASIRRAIRVTTTCRAGR